MRIQTNVYQHIIQWIIVRKKRQWYASEVKCLEGIPI